MALNKQKGNMYGFVTHTWNPISGACEYDCTYCYLKKWKQTFNAIYLKAKELNTDLGGEPKTIFIGSGCDMFAPSVPDEWLKKVFDLCKANRHNTYFFQTKNPERFLMLKDLLPYGSILCTTIESDIDHGISRAPSVKERAKHLGLLKGSGFKTMVTIEPVLDFNVDGLAELISIASPDQVNIGADSKKNDLKEPDREKLMVLIAALNFAPDIKVHLKKNLKRILKWHG